MEITRVGSQPSAQGPADWFTGTVRVDSFFQRPKPARIGGGIVTFEPGARTAWHTHPLRTNVDHYFWLRVGAARGRGGRRGSPRRHRMASRLAKNTGMAQRRTRL